MKILILCLIFIGISCSEERTSKSKTKDGPYIDSVYFSHYKRVKKPYLISTTSYAFNDSISESLDSMAMDKLLKLNIESRSEKDPLGYIKNGDTVIVDLIHIPPYGKFCFGEIRTRGDTILLKLSGDVYKELPKISERLHVPYRYFRSRFKILTDSCSNHKIFFRYNDSFELNR